VFYLVRLADLVKEATFKHHHKSVTSKTDKNIIFNYLSVAHERQVSLQLWSLWLVSRMEARGVRNREKGSLPSVLFAPLYRYVSHLVLKVTGTGFTNKTNKNICGLFETTFFFKRRFITMCIIPT